ncbi:MAG: hypothetical protein HOM65_00875, partial [Verrucomicrobia bacterium]|nr:hypothetical protein [Verrucomicrobiota bacterium]
MNITQRNYNSSWRRLLAATFALWACISALPWASALQGAACPVVEFNGQVQADELTDTPWVTNATMWGIVDHGNASATSATGFLSMNFPGFNPSLFRWEFGNTENLELSTAISPSAVSPGKEIYTNTQGAAVSIEFFYDNVLWATGVVDFIEVNVADVNAGGATGSGGVTLTSSGNTSDFFDEVMALTGGSGGLVFTFNGFEAVNAQGLFQTNGSFTLDPCSPPSPITVNAGLDQTAVTGSYVQLWGYRELGDNVDNGQDTYLWEQLEGPDVTLLQGSSFAFGLIKFNAPEVDAVTDLVFRLTITDGEDQSTDEVKIVVYPIPDLGVEGVEFEIGDMQLTDTFGAGETFIRDIHPSNSELSRPVFEFEVAQSQLKDQAFYDAGNVPSAGIYGAQEGDWVLHNKAKLSFHYTDVTIRPNLEYLGSNPNGVSFLIWDRKDWSDGEDQHPIVFGVNGDIKVVQTLKELNGLKLGGTRISIVGAEDYVDPGQGGPIGRSRGLVSVVGAPIEKFVIGAGTSIDVDHIYPAAPAWAQPGLIAEAGLNQDVYADQVIQLNGTLSTQSNDDSITYQWTQVDPDIDVVISDADSLQPTFIAPEVPDGFIVLTFQLTASEGAVSDQDTVDIKVFPAVNIANAGPDQTALEGSYVQLTGSNEGPGIEGSFNTYQWVQQSGPQIEVDGGGVMTNQSISFYAPNVDQITELTFVLSVTNGGVTSTDSVTVEVYPIEDLGANCVNFDMGAAL